MSVPPSAPGLAEPPPPPAAPPGQHRPWLRVVAGILGIALAAATASAAIIEAFFVMVAMEVPDAYASGGEFLSYTPETWTDVAETVAIMTAGGLIVGVMAAITVAAGVFAVRDRAPKRRPVAILATVPPLLVLMVLCTGLAIKRDEARLAVDCGEFRFDRAAFASAESKRWDRQALGLQDCNTLDGRTAAQVRAALGPAEQEGSAWWYHDERVLVSFRRGRLEQVASYR